MQRQVSPSDLAIFAELDLVYNNARMIEANQNKTKYKCLGSGHCCTIGLTIHMTECANIAYNITQQFYLYLEDKGEEYADEWFKSVVGSLKDAMNDPTWEFGGKTERKCAFYKNGCTIYKFRPLVCRSYGAFVGVDDACPRERNVYGNVDHFSGEPVQKMVKRFQEIMSKYSKGKDPNYDVVVYMPLGVLSYLLPAAELEELARNTDDRMWKAVEGWFNYRVEYTKIHGLPMPRLRSEAEKSGKKIAFSVEE